MNVSLHDISPSSWHYSSNSLEYYILVSHEPKLVWYFTIILAPFNQNSLGYYMLASYEHKLVWYFTIILALFIQNSLYWYDGQWPSYDVNMVFHHTFGTIHLKQLVLVWWSVAKLWREYGISPSSWHHSSKTA